MDSTRNSPKRLCLPSLRPDVSLTYHATDPEGHEGLSMSDTESVYYDALEYPVQSTMASTSYSSVIQQATILPSKPDRSSPLREALRGEVPPEFEFIEPDASLKHSNQSKTNFRPSSQLKKRSQLQPRPIFVDQDKHIDTALFPKRCEHVPKCPTPKAPRKYGPLLVDYREEGNKRKRQHFASRKTWKGDSNHVGFTLAPFPPDSDPFASNNQTMALWGLVSEQQQQQEEEEEEEEETSPPKQQPAAVAPPIIIVTTPEGETMYPHDFDVWPAPDTRKAWYIRPPGEKYVDGEQRPSIDLDVSRASSDISWVKQYLRRRKRERRERSVNRDTIGSGDFQQLRDGTRRQGWSGRVMEVLKGRFSKKRDSDNS